MFFGVLTDVLFADEFSADDLPFWAAEIGSDIVGGESVVSPLDDLFISA